MLCSGKRYQPVAEMSEIADLLKTWMAEARRQEERWEKERDRYAEERRHYEQDRAEERVDTKNY